MTIMLDYTKRGKPKDADRNRRERVMHVRRYVVGLVLVGGFVVGAAIESQAAPVLTNTAAVRSAAPSLAIDIRRHHWRWGYWRWGGGRSSICWDRGRRVVCPGSPPGN
jgi:hypothetical protein